jgi:hypothetical protein
MNIYAKEGDKVIVTEEGIGNGYDGDKRHAEKYLEVGNIYTIDSIEVSGWSTVVNLKEFPEQCFNSVHFEDYKEPKTKKDKVKKSKEVKVEEVKKMTAEDFMNSKGWSEKDPIWGGALFKTIASLLNEYSIYLNN